MIFQMTCHRISSQQCLEIFSPVSISKSHYDEDGCSQLGGFTPTPLDKAAYAPLVRVRISQVGVRPWRCDDKTLEILQVRLLRSAACLLKPCDATFPSNTLSTVKVRRHRCANDMGGDCYRTVWYDQYGRHFPSSSS